MFTGCVMNTLIPLFPRPVVLLIIIYYNISVFMIFHETNQYNIVQNKICYVKLYQKTVLQKIKIISIFRYKLKPLNRKNRERNNL